VRTRTGRACEKNNGSTELIEGSPKTAGIYLIFSFSYYGWVVVGMCALANMVAFGLVYSYGVFFKPLAVELGYERSVW